MLLGAGAASATSMPPREATGRESVRQLPCGQLLRGVLVGHRCVQRGLQRPGGRVGEAAASIRARSVYQRSDDLMLLLRQRPQRVRVQFRRCLSHRGTDLEQVVDVLPVLTDEGVGGGSGSGGGGGGGGGGIVTGVPGGLDLVVACGGESLHGKRVHSRRSLRGALGLAFAGHAGIFSAVASPGTTTTTPQQRAAGSGRGAGCPVRINS